MPKLSGGDLFYSGFSSSPQPQLSLLLSCSWNLTRKVAGCTVASCGVSYTLTFGPETHAHFQAKIGERVREEGWMNSDP